ncbi:hypothetical protein [Trichloromonas acetexigens]|jgi:hypothetical protein|uniref:Uncharacterized protein n=1 Tax=Trichloromonas acetexigens TaxID=38815 RepID=A0A550JLL2_9BACT|nr:hypothetical protein [Desulfuromonas acetexigens]TRO84053.1 hypothetical protein FL622_02415 [Desulfuromonas acetexigens]
MKLRVFLFALFVACHTLLPLLELERLSRIVAGSVYWPLQVLAWIKLPVFAGPLNNGWAAPSFYGWFVVLVLWGALWWLLAAILAHPFRKTTAPTPTSTHEGNPLFRLVANTLVNGTALLLYGIGLAAPLTRSVGRTSFVEILLLVGLPCALLVVCASKTRKLVNKTYFLLQSVVLVGSAIYFIYF